MDNDTDANGNSRKTYITDGVRFVRAQRTAAIKPGWRICSPDEIATARLAAKEG